MDLLELAEQRGLHTLDNEAARIFTAMRLERDGHAHRALESRGAMGKGARQRIIGEADDYVNPYYFWHKKRYHDVREFEFSADGFSNVVDGIYLYRVVDNHVFIIEGARNEYQSRNRG